MKFLIKIEEAIDQLILNFIEKMKHATPHFVFASIAWIKNSPKLVKTLIDICLPKVRLFCLKLVGHIQHIVASMKGSVLGILHYFKSEEFKQKNKIEWVFSPIMAFKHEPAKAFSALLVTVIVGSASFFIFKNTEKIIIGTKALRAPASAHMTEEPILEFKKLKYEVHEKEVHFDVTIVAVSVEERDKLIPLEKEIEKDLLGIHIKAHQLPLSHEELKALENEMMSKITAAKISSVEVKQILEGRPKYFLQLEKLASFKDLNLQLFLEDTRRNRQVWIDFTALANNRNVILFLKDHDVEVRDYINMHVEPVIPQLPIEEEGRQIIKEKVRQELNQYLKENGIEGKILEIYVDYLMVS